MTDLFSVERKTIVITGGFRGIGRELVNYFLDKNAKVICLDKYDNKKINKNYTYIKTDFSIEGEKLRKNLNRFLKNYKVDVLINNAAVTFSNSTLDYKLNDWNKTIQVNLNSVFILSQIIAKNMIKNKINGSIINVTSIGGMMGFPNNPAYTATKGAISNLTRSMALDLGKNNIRVNNIVPGYTKTPMNIKSWKNKKKYNERAARTMLGRWANAHEYNGALNFLASEASSYVTGSDFIIDGGWLNKGL